MLEVRKTSSGESIVNCHASTSGNAGEVVHPELDHWVALSFDLRLNNMQSQINTGEMQHYVTEESRVELQYLIRLRLGS